MVCVCRAEHSEEGEVPEAKKPRLDEEDSDDEEEEPESMIAVPEGGGVAPAAEGTNEVAAAEAERKASLTRASMSLEERQRRFKDMLLERGVGGWVASRIMPLALYVTTMHNQLLLYCSAVCTK